MQLSASEKATLHFYEWEYLGRGYYHFDEQVAIEPPFRPFYHKAFEQAHIDDGRAPSIFKQIGDLFLPSSKEVEEKQESVEVIPNTTQQKKLCCFSLIFPKHFEISLVITKEFLSMLAYSEYSISFEIIGTDQTITIQFVCDVDDRGRVESLLKGYFPLVILKEQEVYNLQFDTNRTVAICDFGLSDEFVRPIESVSSFGIDPLTAVIATLDNLQNGNIAMLQVIFQGVTSPWSKNILSAVSDGQGGSFFSDAPEMLICAKEKVKTPLFSSIIRIATQGNNNEQSQYLARELSRSICSISSSSFNTLIPLSNEGYEYEHHLHNVYKRTSNRLGMLLNTEELTTFIHYPNKTIVSSKLGLQGGKTKILPQEAINQKYVLGINKHNGIENEVSIDDESRLRHTHIIGATGVGKSTLIANMILEDMDAGNGCALFDPHGDIVDDILLRISEDRKNDVIVINPSDTEFPIGFNLLKASTEAEKIVLSSDLVSAFKRHATAWGDNMTAVLSNAINTFLESSKGGTIIELKRFLIEDVYRKEFLQSVEDPSLHYYWEHEYYMVKKRIAPLLTRIDTFLRPKIVRYMLAQKEGVDFKECIEQKKIVLIKLSQGLIGEENSYLLGSLFLSKLNQVAQGRQLLSKDKRHPYYIYLDEFQNFITPSITSILSGARKYGIGLVLAHQELGQIEETKILNSVISNPHTRICFRLGDTDAKKLEAGFSYFEQSDLQSLDIGQAIMRLGSSHNDFNISTFPLSKVNPQTSEDNKEAIIQNTRDKYSRPQLEIEELLKKLLPRVSEKATRKIKEKAPIQNTIDKPIIEIKEDKIEIYVDTEETEISTPIESSVTDFETQKESYLNKEKEKELVRKHRTLQNFVQTIAVQRGFKATLEEEVLDGKVDVGLLRNELKIAIEISVTNSSDYEVQNIQKCLDNGYQIVVMISDSQVHLENIKEKALHTIAKKQHSKIHFIASMQFPDLLDELEPKTIVSEKRIKGYRVKTSYNAQTNSDPNQKSITSILMKALQNKK